MTSYRLSLSILLILIGGLATSCTSINITHPEMVSKIDVPSYVKSSKGDVQVSIYRSKAFSGSLNRDWIMVDDKVIGGVLCGEQMEFYIPSKKVKIGNSSIGGWSEGWKVKNVIVTPGRGQKLYFITKNKYTKWSENSQVVQVSESEYHKVAKGANRVSLGSYGQ